jgi:hypothetical protein
MKHSGRLTAVVLNPLPTNLEAITTTFSVSGVSGGAIGTDPVTGAVGGATGVIAGAIADRILAVENECEDECGE